MITVNQLGSKEYVGISIIEITSFPNIVSDEGYKEDVTVQEKNILQFKQIVREFYNSSIEDKAVLELLWISEPVTRQQYKAKIRIFLNIRVKSDNKEMLISRLYNQEKEMVNSLILMNYHVNEEIDFYSFNDCMSKIETSSVKTILKKEKKTAISLLTAGSYEYSEVIAVNSIDNFELLLSSLSQNPNCMISFQLFPSWFLETEKQSISNTYSFYSQQFTRPEFGQDVALSEPYSAIKYYYDNINVSMCEYNIIVFGDNSSCANITNRVISLIQSGREKVTEIELNVQELLNFPKTLIRDDNIYIYPWSLHNQIVNKKSKNRASYAFSEYNTNAFLLKKMTIDEALVFFRLPMFSKKTIGILENERVSLDENIIEKYVDSENIYFGDIVSNNGKIEIGAPLDLFTRHSVIVGSTGTGKTTFALNLLLQFAKKEIPFLAIEPTKSEYRVLIDKIQDLQIFTPGNNKVSPFIINPFIPPKGIRLEQYKPSLMNAFNAAFSMPSPLDVIFLNAINQCYIRHGWRDSSMLGDSGTELFGLQEFIIVFKNIIDKSDYKSDFKGNVKTAGTFRLMNLLEQNASIYDTVNTIPIEDLLSKPTVIELNAIDNYEQKALIMALLLTNICVYTKNLQKGDGVLKNIILIDEAHVLLEQKTGSTTDIDAGTSTVKALQNMILEVRSYGTGMIISDQSPLKIGDEILSQTAIKVMFKLQTDMQKEAVASCTNMDDKLRDSMLTLDKGTAYVYLEQMKAPRLIKTPDTFNDNALRHVITNEEISGKNSYWITHSDLLKPFNECNSCALCSEGCDTDVHCSARFFANYFYYLNENKKINYDNYMSAFNLVIQRMANIEELRNLARIKECAKIHLIRKLALEKNIHIKENESNEQSNKTS